MEAKEVKEAMFYGFATRNIFQNEYVKYYFISRIVPQKIYLLNGIITNRTVNCVNRLDPI